jgi:hypothetical protein
MEEHGEALSDPPLGDSMRRERLLAAGAVEACLSLAGQQAMCAARSGNHHRASPWERVEEAPRLPLLPARLARKLTIGADATEVRIEVLPQAGGALALTVHWEGASHRALYLPGPAGDAPAALPLPAPPAMGGAGVLDLDELRLPLRWDALGFQRWLTLRGLHFHGTALDPAEAAARVAGGEAAAERLRAPLPGKVIKVAVRPGDAVAGGQVLVVMEAMKVEHTITAPFRGRVARVLFQAGEQVNRDDQLVELEPLEG